MDTKLVASHNPAARFRWQSGISSIFFTCLIAFMSIDAVCAQASEAQLSSELARGQSIYHQGRHQDGRPLTALSGDTSAPLPNAFVACVNCHGYQARGKTEGGITSGDIRWGVLSKPYDLVRPDGRHRAPYDATSFFIALTTGKDPSGQALNSSMPRFDLSAMETTDLLAYLKNLTPADEGVGDDIIRIGIALPTDPKLARRAQSDQKLLNAWVENVNRKGGVFRRRLVLVMNVATPRPGTPPVLAVLASDTNTASTPPTMPVVAVLADSLAPYSRYHFSLYPGSLERIRTLASYATPLKRSAASPLAIVYPEGATSSALLDGAITALQPLTKVRPTPILATGVDEVVANLRAEGIESVLLLGNEMYFQDFIASASRQQWQPLLLWEEMPEHLPRNANQMRAITTAPALATDISTEARAVYARCVGHAGSNAHEQVRQLGLLAAAQLLLVALENTGRTLDRERLVDTLEEMHEFRSGFAPRGGFSVKRHRAASGLYVIPLPGSRFQAAPTWMGLD
ncbi:ABC transporter substrate-binding protein [Undibacterium sp. Di26W]|uniref:ABC transporter substrate-binding protein n=1 Tax=Undibacterium sp. Di26W TaxID=3413035 RepID=UPI003BF41655